LALRELLILYARAVAEIEPGAAVTGETRAGSRAGILAGAVAHSLQENLAAPLGVAALARYHGVTPSHLARLFKRERGVGPRAFLIAARVARARERLRTSDAPLKAIAAEYGFVDAAHLSHAFKAAIGVSPARWRREEAGGNDQ
jgi:transcriptional regulator GlxA family with amidase domain